MTPETEFKTLMNSRYAVVHGFCAHPEQSTSIITRKHNAIHLRGLINTSCVEQVVKYTAYAVCDHLALIILKQIPKYQIPKNRNLTGTCVKC